MLREWAVLRTVTVVLLVLVESTRRSNEEDETDAPSFESKATAAKPRAVAADAWAIERLLFMAHVLWLVLRVAT